MPHTAAAALASPWCADSDLAAHLADISAREMVEQLGLARAPGAVRSGLSRTLSWASKRLGQALARFDGRIGALGIAQAAAATLDDLGATWQAVGPNPPRDGPLLVVSNHPGAYDALVLLAALGRRDVGILAANRPFLRALPELRQHLLLLADDGRAGGRVSPVRRAFAHLARGHVLVHFPAGRIEPDPAFVESGSPLLAKWSRGTGAIVRATARANGRVAGALVSAVHSTRAKRHWAVRWAERRGVTTVAPLLQIVAPRFRDVRAVVRFTEASAAARLLDAGDNDAAVTERLRTEVEALAHCGS